MLSALYDSVGATIGTTRLDIGIIVRDYYGAETSCEPTGDE